LIKGVYIFYKKGDDMKGIYKFNFDCGRMGHIDGIFVEEKELVDALIESKISVYFGEVLGKCSEIYGNIDNEDVKLISDSPEAVDVITRFNLEVGYNPFNYCVFGDIPESIKDAQKDDWYVEEAIKLYIERKENNKL